MADRTWSVASLDETGLKSLERRLWVKIQPAEAMSCWQWTGVQDGDGYGKIRAGGEHRRAHRITYELLRAEIPAGLQLDHLCRNRACVNPWHLEPVTLVVNVRRGNTGKVKTPRQAVTTCKRGHEFTPENIAWGWSIAPNGKRYRTRRCRICKREWHRNNAK